MHLRRQFPTFVLALAAATVVVASPSAVGALEVSPIWADLNETTHSPDQVIQQRRFVLHHELDVLVGAIPSDPFYKGLAFTAGYTLHFNNYVAWEILSFAYVQGFTTRLKTELVSVINDLRGNGAFVEPPLPEVNAYLATHFILKPFYGKQALQDYGLAHVEVFGQLGPALMQVTTLQEQSYVAAADWGIGLRLWFSDAISARLQLGQLLYVVDRTLFEALHIDGGLSFNFGGDE